jgi:acyl-CoA thioesterase-1
MERFFKRIKEKALDHSQSPVLIVAFGDSVTQGAMEHSRLDSASVYHRLLQEKLESFFPLTTFSTLNAGVSGDTAHKGLERLERDVLRHEPDLVLIAFGLNDSVGGEERHAEFEADLSVIQNRIRERTQADVMFITPPFMATKRTERIHPEHEMYAENIISTQTNDSAPRDWIRTSG